MVSADDGKKLAEYELQALPVWDGLVIADDKVFISLKNGKMVCLDKE